jgi:uncharacterized membrane protein
MTSFRATGNEPGWRLDITDSKLTFLGDYGKTRLETATPAVETTAAFREYTARSGGHELIVRIFDRPCSDTMSGMPHPNEVTVTLDGKRLNVAAATPARC